MRNFFATLSLFSLGFQAQAMTFDCRSIRAGQNLRLLVEGESGRGPASLSLFVNGEAVYSKVPAVETSQASVLSFQSPSFINRKDAPASLFVQVWREPSGAFSATFSETSYVWVAPHFTARCQAY